MASTIFQKATDFLAAQIQSGPIARIAVNQARSAFNGVYDVTKRIDDLFQGAFDRLEIAIDEKLADLKDENQRASIRLTYASTLRIPVDEQMSLLESGRHSHQVTCAAAQQRNIPLPVQKFLVENCYDHRDAMIALARNLDADIGLSQQLAAHPHADVRRTFAAHICARIPVNEPGLNDVKGAAYRAILDNYSGELAPYVVPVCRNEEHLIELFCQTSKNPASLRHFVENPYTPDQVLLDICTSTSLRIMPGGNAVANDAKKRVDKSLSADGDSTLQLG